MPMSTSELKDWTAKKFNEIKPSYVLDVGPGVGTYSDLLRDPYTVWGAIEIWGPYIKKYDLHSKYDFVTIGDISAVTPDFFKGAFIFCGDVLEHLTHQQAVDVVEKMMDRADYILVSIPLGLYPQGEHEGNPYEEHKSTWIHSEVMEQLFQGSYKVEYQIGKKVGVYLWRKNA